MGLLFVPIWKEAPFIRLTIPLIAGIVAGSFLSFDAAWYWAALLFAIFATIIFSRFKLSLRFVYGFLFGPFINILFISIGALLVRYNDTSANAERVEALCRDGPVFIATLKEPASERAASYKAVCGITAVRSNGSCVEGLTNLIVYFRKDSTRSPPAYGERIAFVKLPERIKNIPGAAGFDYVKYCARQNIYFQVFLRQDEFIKVEGRKENRLWAVLFRLQQWIVGVLRRNIPGRKECGLAEALLIGYKNDLDRQLIQSYSNTGVVHVVAISGLHLGLVYALLKYCCAPFGKRRTGRWIAAVIITCGLWTFSLLAGASPSVLRSAVMFSFIVAGEVTDRKTALFNNLSASAFLLLCYDPYWLWDIGFQLSYAALLSIAIFMKPIYHLLIFKNKVLDIVWKLNAVTLAAQVLTAPLCIYYFHQFPTLFLITNFIAVPLSSAILMGEIALCCTAFVKWLPGITGWLLAQLLKFMNGMIEMLGSFSFSSVKGIGISVVQTIFLYVIIFCLSAWLISGRRRGLPLALIASILFMAVRFI